MGIVIGAAFCFHNSILQCARVLHQQKQLFLPRVLGKFFEKSEKVGTIVDSVL